MASSELRSRSNWQTISGDMALKVEDKFIMALQAGLDSLYPGTFKVDHHPKDFKTIYSKHVLSNDVLNSIYNVPMTKANGKDKYKWGFEPDFAIRNTKNNKILFGEIKRQDGWIEGGKPKDGRGNAHERGCKYFTPGLLKTLYDTSKLSRDILPFWIIYVGNITRDPRRNREISYWFDEFTSNYFMWRDQNEIGSVLDFFENNLLKYLLD